MVAVIDEIRRAPSSGVRYSFSTEVRTSLTSRSQTCHFGSIFGPNSFGFIEANCWTRDADTVAAIPEPPWVGQRVHVPGCHRIGSCQTESPAISAFFGPSAASYAASVAAAAASRE